MKLFTLIALAGSLAAQEKTPVRVGTRPRPTTKTFAQSCESVWPVALSAAKQSGWKVTTLYQGSAIYSPAGTITFAEGERECDVRVQLKKVSPAADRKLLSLIDSRLNKR